jgi:CelD/BcsL family acetyltransferase involved in cellulose biosynthesis
MISFKIFDTIDDQLIYEINKIKHDSFSYVFQMPEWINTLIAFEENQIKLKLIFVYSNSEVILIAPLCIKNKYGYKELSWLTSDIIDYNGIIISKTFDFTDKFFISSWQKIIKILSSECDIIFFNKIPEFIETSFNPILDNHYKFYQNSYQLNLDNFNYNYFYNKKNNNKAQQTDRRKQKKLNEGNDLSCSHLAINSANMKLVENLVFEKISFYKKQKQKTFFYNYLVCAYKNLIKFSANNFTFNISILKKNNKKISSILGVIFNNRYYYLIPFVHNTEYKKFSPGRLHIIKLIDWANKNKIRLIDFTAGDENYKSNWSNFNFKMYYYIKLINLSGLFRFIFLNLYFRLRKNFFLKKIYQFTQI